MNNKVSFITGITGQDGSYLTEQLLNDGHIVFGIIRRSSVFNTENIDHLMDNPNLRLKHGDITDFACIIHILEDIKLLNPDMIYIYNLAAQSHVKISFDVPLYTAQVDAIGTLNILEAVRATGLINQARIYQASTSEMYGKVTTIPQNELTPFYPRSPYGVAKLYSYWIVKNYRESYGMFCCNGILFNHESQRRGKTFVTRKITVGISNILKGKQKYISLGNLDAKRDWGYAPDYCLGMRKILEHDIPNDFVLATGEYHSVREFVELAFKYVNINIVWKGEGINEVGINNDNNGDNILVKVDPKYFRPAEVDELLGDASKAKKLLNWEPRVSFRELVNIMMQNDINI